MSDLSPRMAIAFADLRADCQFVPDAARRARARVVMHEARARHASRPALAAWWETVRRPVRVAAPVVAVAGATWLLVAGWSAPAGTPLHPLRLAREEAQLALPGSDRVGLELSFAEDRLREAAAGPDPEASLQEAASLLADARVHLPSNHTTPVWRTWQADVETLSRTKQNLAPAGTSTSPSSTSANGGGPPPVNASVSSSVGSTTTTSSSSRSSSRTTSSRSTSSSNPSSASSTTNGESSSVTTSDSISTVSDSTAVSVSSDTSAPPLLVESSMTTSSTSTSSGGR